MSIATKTYWQSLNEEQRQEYVKKHKENSREAIKEYWIKYREDNFENLGVIAKKNILFEERGEKCEECDISEWRNRKLSIQLHHIDGDNRNNKRNNLKLLCPNCHSITENYCGRNRPAHNKGKFGYKRNRRKNIKYFEENIEEL